MANLTDLSKSGLRGNLQRALEDNLQPDETIDVSINPRSGEGLVVTDRRVLIIKAGTTTGSGLFGARCKTFRFTDISSVDLRIGLVGGHIQISVAGTTEVKDYGMLDMVKAENAVTFDSRFKREIREIVALINERVAAAKTNTAAAAGGLADELAKLANLRASGVLNDEEFAAAKARLLER